MTQTERRTEPRPDGTNVVPFIVLTHERMGEEMFAALKNGEVGRLRHLLSMGGDPDSRNRDGYTLLMTAVKDNAEDAIDALLAACADLNALGPDGKNAILLAAGGNPSIARTLMESYADLGRVDPSSPDAVEVAKKHGNYALAAEIEQRKNNEAYKKAAEEKKKEIEIKKEERSRIREYACAVGDTLSSAFAAATASTRTAKNYVVEKTVRAKDKTVKLAKVFAATTAKHTVAFASMCSRFIKDFRTAAPEKTQEKTGPSIDEIRLAAADMLASPDFVGPPLPTFVGPLPRACLKPPGAY